MSWMSSASSSGNAISSATSASGSSLSSAGTAAGSTAGAGSTAMGSGSSAVNGAMSSTADTQAMMGAAGGQQLSGGSAATSANVGQAANTNISSGVSWPGNTSNLEGTGAGAQVAKPVAPSEIKPNSIDSFQQGYNSGGGVNSLIDMYKAYKDGDYTRLAGNAMSLGSSQRGQYSNNPYQEMYNVYRRR